MQRLSSWSRSILVLLLVMATGVAWGQDAFFQANTGKLWNSRTGDTGMNMKAGTSPSADGMGGAWFQNASGVLKNSRTGSAHLGMMAGTSPSADELGGAWFQANTGKLWNSRTGDTGMNMKAGTSPSADGMGGAWFQNASGVLKNSRTGSAHLGMMAGTSPSADQLGGAWFQANTGVLWNSRTGSAYLGMMAGTSPSAKRGVLLTSISGNAGIAGATVTAGGKSAVSDASGNYTILYLNVGTKTVTPSKAGYIFTPASRNVTVPPNATGVNFTASVPVATYSVSGNTGVSGATVTLGGLTTTSDANGNYSFSNNVVAGTFTVTPSKSGCSFAPTSQSVTVGPNKTGINFSTPCSLGFPHGSTSFADDYIKNYPYGSSPAGFSRWQPRTVPNTSDYLFNPPYPANPEPCLNGAPYYIPYPVYSTGYGDPTSHCDPGFGWSPALNTCNGNDPATNCGIYYDHPRPNIGGGVSVWMDGLNGNDTAGYYDTSTGGYHELSDKFIVMDPLGSSNRNSNCAPPENLNNYWTCDQLYATLQTDIWGPDARKVYPGEITPNYWGIVPTDATTWEWEHFVALGGNLYTDNSINIRKGNGFVQVVTSYPDPTPVMDGVFGGGNGPKCIAGANECWQVTWNSGPSRVKIDRIGSEWYVTISGYATNADGIIRNTVDVGVDLAALAGSGSVHGTMYYTILLMNQLGIANTANIVGHSLGALDAVTLYNLGYGKSVTGFATPFMTPIGAMLSRGGRPATFYANSADWVTNQMSLPCFGSYTHVCRVNSGVNEYLVNTGGSYITGNNPHDRNQYEAQAGWYQW